MQNVKRNGGSKMQSRGTHERRTAQKAGVMKREEIKAEKPSDFRTKTKKKTSGKPCFPARLIYLAAQQRSDFGNSHKSTAGNLLDWTLKSDLRSAAFQQSDVAAAKTKEIKRKYQNPAQEVWSLFRRRGRRLR